MSFLDADDLVRTASTCQLKYALPGESLVGDWVQGSGSEGACPASAGR